MKYFLIFMTMSLASEAQVARDFFIPASGKNKSSFSMQKGDADGLKTQVYVEDFGDSVLQTTIYTAGNRTEWKKEIFRISDSEISVTRKMLSGLKEESVKPGEYVIFKLPKDKQDIEWRNPENSGSISISYSAERTKVKIDGVSRNAVKITKNESLKSGKEFFTTSDYYVEGIGFYKEVSENGFIIQLLEEQKKATIPQVGD